MNIIKQYSFKSPRQIWRILISDSDKLILEIRDTNTKEVFFSCFQIENGKKIFESLQLEEKYWLGIETIYKDMIFFHKYPKPDLPGHKGIIAFDINKQKVLWTNIELSFLFVHNDKVYGFKQGFEERYFFALDIWNGELIEERGDDYNAINALRSQAEMEIDWSVYIYPKTFSNDENDFRISRAIRAQTKSLNIEGEVEYNVYKDLLLFNFHSRISKSSFINKFYAVNINTGKVVLSKDLNVNASSLFTDSFFVYKNLLFLLRKKNEVIVYKIE